MRTTLTQPMTPTRHSCNLSWTSTTQSTLVVLDPTWTSTRKVRRRLDRIILLRGATHVPGTTRVRNDIHISTAKRDDHWMVQTMLQEFPLMAPAARKPKVRRFFNPLRLQDTENVAAFQAALQETAKLHDHTPLATTDEKVDYITNHLVALQEEFFDKPAGKPHEALDHPSHMGPGTPLRCRPEGAARRRSPTGDCRACPPTDQVEDGNHA